MEKKQVAKVAKVVPVKAKAEKKASAVRVIIPLLLGKRHTDAEMAKESGKSVAYVSRVRSALNAGYAEIPACDPALSPLIRVDGKLLTKTEAPKATKAAKPKVDMAKIKSFASDDDDAPIVQGKPQKKAAPAATPPKGILKPTNGKKSPAKKK